MAYERAQQGSNDQGEREVPREQQRGALFDLLRTVDFAQGQAALEPTDAADGKKGGPPATPALPPAILARLALLVPTAVAQVDAEETGKEPEATPGATPADAADKDAAEAAQAVTAMAEAEAEDDVADEPEAHEADAHADEAGAGAHAPAHHAPAHHAKPAKAHKSARPKATPHRRVQRKAAHARAPEAPKLLLSYPRAKAAFLWTKKRNFAHQPFMMRRFTMVLPMGVTATVSFAFVQAVAQFQKDHRIPVTGRFIGKTVRAVNFLLRKRYGLDKLGLLTAREVRLAHNNARRQLSTGHLKRKTVKEMRQLLGMAPGKGELGPGFLRKLAEFQRKHGLTPSAYISKRTIKKLRQTAIPGPNASNSAKLAYAKKHAGQVGLVITSTTGGKHAAGSYHYRGRAIDVAGSPSNMARYYRDLVPLRPTELFYDPEGGIKYGQSIGAIGNHSDHVHVAF